eukprot:Skav203938  [mRNA]  locus=scaffold779:145636:155052:+ [translate_table: standard]
MTSRSPPPNLPSRSVALAMSRPWPYNPQPTFPPLPTSPGGPSSPSSASVREALRSIGAEDLEEELRKLQEELRAAGMVVSPTRARPKRQLPEHREIQTDPWMPMAPKQEVVKVVEQPARVDPEPQAPKPKKEKRLGQNRL